MVYSPPANAGTLSYNTHTFSLFAKTTISSRPVLDTAKRNVTHNEITIEVEDYLTDLNDVTTQVANAERALSARGGHLTIASKGYNLEVNAEATGVRDVMYGPIPQLIELRPIGARLAWKIRWRCQVNVPTCALADYTGVMEFTYSWHVTVNEEGYSTRTIAGRLVIAATTRVGVRVPVDDADAYWDQVVAAFPPLNSFHRASNRQLSEDRRTLNYTLIDSEKPQGAFLPGIAYWTGRQQVTRSRPDHWYKPAVRISATYTLDRGRAKEVALRHFIELAHSRTQAARGKDVFPLEFSVDDGLGRENLSVAFTLRYVHLVDRDPGQALAESGMWRAIPGSSWIGWATSMARTALNGRGDAQLFFNRQADVLINLCDDQRLGVRSDNVLGARQLGAAGAELRATLPPRGRSWLHYRCRLEAISDTGITTLRTLPLAGLPQPRDEEGGRHVISTPDAGDSLATNRQARGQQAAGGARTRSAARARSGSATGRSGASGVNLLGGAQLVNEQAGQELSRLDNQASQEGESTTHVQRRTGPLIRIRVVGRAVRWGYPIAPPTLLGALGGQAVLEQPRFAQQVITAAGGPVAVASWADTYVIPQARQSALPFPPLGFGLGG